MKRLEYLSWEESFMLVAIISSLRSKDPSKRVGACIVNEDNVIVGTGYNGLPRGFDDDQFSWEKSDNFVDNRNSYVVHGEENAIANSRGELKGCRLYVTLFPCNECAKLIAQKGIKEIVYLAESNRHNEYVIVAEKILKNAGVKLTKSTVNPKEMMERLPLLMEELFQKDLGLIGIYNSIIEKLVLVHLERVFGLKIFTYTDQKVQRLLQ